MYKKIYIAFLLLLSSAGTYAQTDSKTIRVVDTLSAQEKANRNPVLLRTELDSLVKSQLASQPVQEVQQPEETKTGNDQQYLLAGLAIMVALLLLVIWLLYRYQQKVNHHIGLLKEKEEAVFKTEASAGQSLKEKKGKLSAAALESKINELNTELQRLSGENETMGRVIKEYNGIQHDFESLKKGMLRSYKVKNYPGYDKTKNEATAMQTVLETENAVVAFAYEKFLKPILAITDANKNNPAKLNEADNKKLLDLLVSLSLLYIEYLYLRVNDLAIGGHIAERIKELSKGKGPDASLLKKMNKEFGSRALVIRIALDKLSLNQLSYPVFDETNLNNQ